MNVAQQHLLTKLGSAWEQTPDLNFGKLVESIDNSVWDIVPHRHCSARLMNISDNLFEAALDRWIAEPTARTRFYEPSPV